MTHSEKKDVISRLVNLPTSNKRAFWGRELKSLNELIKLYPKEDFWKVVELPQKLDSIILLRSGYYATVIKNLYNRFNFVIKKPKKITLGEKAGEDYTPKTETKTLKDFLS